MAASSSTGASAGNPENKSYQVFINHRGVDVKKTFARSLYLRLLENGLTAFLDNDEMQAGYNISSQLKQAIGTAVVHVAIFSPRYAESSWCLNELLMMLETKAPIIPVFYHVTPAEVRWTGRKDGKYAQGLITLSEKTTREGTNRYDFNTIQNWRQALSSVADNSGFELEVRNGEELELELLDKMVKCLLGMVNKDLHLVKPGLYVADYPTGLDHKLKHFEDTVLLPQQRSRKPQIFGIWGLGGVGKTTLAKQFFNRKSSSYEKSWFLFDVKNHKADGGSLMSLQKQLLKNLTGLDKPINSVDEGKCMLGESLESVEALVILDDVNDVNHVEALLPIQTHHVLHPRSLILITSRGKDVLRRSRVEESSIYKLSELDTQHSRELFCSHAFSQTYPLLGFETVVDKFLASFKGLPLSLKVFGGLLYGKNISQWEDELECLHQILPGSEIYKTFRVSYDSLNDEEKHIFLDIACFFLGQNRDTAISIWNGSEWKGRRGLQNLQDKSLVEVGRWNEIHMHDHLRDLGRCIAATSPPPQRRLCRWTEDVIDDLLQQSEWPVKSVRGIKIDLSEYNDDDDVLGVICTRRLKILDTEDSLLELILNREKSANLGRNLMRVKAPNLLWLRWRECPYSSLPSWIPVKNLKYLEVSGSALNTLWQSPGESQLSESLEEFRADGCVQLKSISGLELSTKLRRLILKECFELEQLPSIERFVFLEVLYPTNCVKLKSIRGLERLTKLRYLDVSGCSELEKLPSVETLISLEGLWADGCAKLKIIRGLQQLTKLQKLIVSGCSELEELPSMERLVSLEELWAKECVKLKTIRGLQQLTKLRKISVVGCSELEDLSSMETLVSLEELWAMECVKLKIIRGLQQSTKLWKLRVSGCSELEELPNMGKLVSLEELWANKCVKLKIMRGLEQSTKLRKLIVYDCLELEELPSMKTLASLEELWAAGCVQLKRIRGLDQATKLQQLRVDGCSALEELPSMKTLVSLEVLSADGCVKLKSIRGLAHATKLQRLSVCFCHELEEVEDLEHCTWLETLDISGCPKLKCSVWE